LKNEITFSLEGRYALFTDPLTKLGGEKSTLLIPTYQAIKGCCESLYWKPSIVWCVDDCIIVNKIQTEAKGIRPIKYGGGNDLAYYTYLSNVKYLIRAHFEFNKNRMDLEHDFCENKHYFIAKRSLEKGGRRDIFLGVRECQAYVEPTAFDLSLSYYKDKGDMDYGLQYHSLSYPDENDKEMLIAKFWYPKLHNGVIKFCRPENCPKEVPIRKMSSKIFDSNNFSGLLEKDLLQGYKGGEEL